MISRDDIVGVVDLSELTSVTLYIIFYLIDQWSDSLVSQFEKTVQKSSASLAQCPVDN